MPEFRSIEVGSTWKLFPRHQAGDSYQDLDKKTAKNMLEGIEKYGVMNRSVILKREANAMCVLDGWQMYQACIKAECKPPFVELLGGIAPEDYVRVVNDFRRHETKAERAKRLKARKKLLRVAVADGVPVPEAAKDVGISASQAYRELANPVRCEKCAALDVSGDNCAKCQLLRLDDDSEEDEDPEPPEGESTEPEAPEPEPELPVMDANFVIVPENVLEAFRVAGELAHICHDVDNIAKRLARIIDGKTGARYVSPTAAQRFKDLREHLWQARATYVCAYCQGQNLECTGCRGQGWLSKTAFANAPTQMQDEMRKIGSRNVPI